MRVSARREKLLATFLAACPAAERLFERELVAGIEAVVSVAARRPKPKRAAVDGPIVALIDRIARRYELTFEDVAGREKTRIHVEARQEVIVALRAAGLSTPEIGRIIGRDHSTVIYHLNCKTPKAIVNAASVHMPTTGTVCKAPVNLRACIGEAA